MCVYIQVFVERTTGFSLINKTCALEWHQQLCQHHSEMSLLCTEMRWTDHNVVLNSQPCPCDASQPTIPCGCLLIRSATIQRCTGANSWLTGDIKCYCVAVRSILDEKGRISWKQQINCSIKGHLYWSQECVKTLDNIQKSYQKNTRLFTWLYGNQ